MKSMLGFSSTHLILWDIEYSIEEGKIIFSKLNLNRVKNLIWYYCKKVRFILNGELKETEIRILNDENRESLLNTSSVDSFIMAVNK